MYRKRYRQLLSKLQGVLVVELISGQIHAIAEGVYSTIALVSDDGECISRSCGILHESGSLKSSLVRWNEKFVMGMKGCWGKLAVNIMERSTSESRSRSLSEPGTSKKHGHNSTRFHQMASRNNRANSDGVSTFESLMARCTSRSRGGGYGDVELGRTDNSKLIGQAVLNIEDVHKLLETSCRTSVEVDTAITQQPRAPMFNLYGSRTHKPETSTEYGNKSKTHGYLTLSLSLPSPLRSQCGWFFELTANIVGDIDVARIWVVVHDGVVCIYDW